MGIINRIHFKNLKGDLFGGITAAVVSLPMALAFGVASGAGPTAGLYGAVFIGFFAALFGGTATLISEPTAPMTVVMTAVVSSLIATNPDNGLEMAFTVVMMGGLFQILFGVLRLGKYITLMPYTVISGFMSGIGLILIILQIGPFLGHASGGGVISIISNMPEFLSDIKPVETILAILTVAIIFLTPSRLNRIIPPQLVALLVVTIISFVFFGDAGVRRIGEIPMGLPTLHLPVFTIDQLRSMTVDALMLGMLGSIDALITATIADTLTHSQHDSDRELVGQGIGNLVSGVCGGLPGAGATVGTVVNIQAGGRTILSGIIRALILLVVVLWAGGLTGNIPMAVLAGIAFKVGIDVIDWDFLKRVHQVSMKATWIMYGVMLLTVFVDLITAVGVGVFVANILTIKRLSDLQAEEVTATTDGEDAKFLTQQEKELLQKANDRIILLRLSGAMIFGAAKAISKEQTVMKNYDVLIVDVSDVSLLGVTSSLAIKNWLQDASKKGRRLFVVGAAGSIKGRLEKFRIFELNPPPQLLSERLEALQEAVALIESYKVKVSNAVSNGTGVETDRVVSRITKND